MKDSKEIEYLIRLGKRHLERCDCAIMKVIIHTLEDVQQDSYVWRELNHAKRN